MQLFYSQHGLKIHKTFWLCGITCASLHIYIIQSSARNVQACWCDSLYRTTTKIFSFAVLERWLIYDCETECSFVYLMFAALLHKFNQW